MSDADIIEELRQAAKEAKDAIEDLLSPKGCCTLIKPPVQPCFDDMTSRQCDAAAKTCGAIPVFAPGTRCP